MKKLFCLFLLLPAWGFLSGQRTYPLEGRVLEEQGSRPVAGASVYVPGREDQGTVSDREGRFMLYFPAGTYTVVGEFLGFEPGRREIRVPESQSLTLYLREKSQQIEQVVITAHSARERVAEVQIGVEKIEMAEMSRIPALFGERDLIRSIQLLPGIKSDGDGSSGYQVRGGTSAQNVILLDDATVYNAGHLIGIFSPFNDDALTNASLYKGQIPAQYGGSPPRSSIFRLKMGICRITGSMVPSDCCLPSST
ncbi:MAG: TonB-dependent receptor [Rikenellaceae bacterium]|nr:TonB-dependent receptor [Rikenellaceae bacterium]